MCGCVFVWACVCVVATLSTMIIIMLWLYTLTIIIPVQCLYVVNSCFEVSVHMFTWPAVLTGSALQEVLDSQ